MPMPRRRKADMNCKHKEKTRWKHALYIREREKSMHLCKNQVPPTVKPAYVDPSAFTNVKIFLGTP